MKKAEFNAEEWSSVVQAPLLAGLRVATAEGGGTLRESLAMGKAYQAARERQGESELLDELVSSPPSLDPGMARAAGEDVPAFVGNRIRGAMALVGQRATPEEADAYRDFVVAIAEAVAGASKEGGFLGIGGKPVSDTEQTAIEELRALLGATRQR